jgi:anti-anti-sigma regulatory factor
VRLARALPYSKCEETALLRISIIERRNERRLVLEGKLIAPWTAELRSTCEKARQNLKGRELVVDLKNLTVISQEGENLLVELMNEGVKFRCCGVFTRQMLRQLARRARTQV